VPDDTTEPGWRPLITDAARRAEIAQVIVEIVTDVEAWRADHPSGSDENADYATLRIYTATDDTVPDPDDEAGRALADAVAGIGERHQAGLYGGAARVAFAVGHLSAGDDADAACEMIEGSLVRYLSHPTESYDLISGLVGLAVPVLQRIADGKPSPSSEPLARGILDHLERLSQPAPGGILWRTPPDLLPEWQRQLAPDGYVNLGLAHGVPGIVAILARYVAAGVEVARARPLLDGAVGYLQSVAGPVAGKRYVAWLPAHRPDAPPRVAWCYGDLGVAVAVMSAAIATGRDDWRATALDLAHGMAARPIQEAQVIDAGLCHGAAGNGHLFNRLSQATGDAALARAADAWFAHTLALRSREPIAGFPRGLPGEDGPTWEAGADLLTGAPGVALALHAAISPIEPAWDQLLLADLAPST
jgi:lantibiotic biosynthesis protein